MAGYQRNLMYFNKQSYSTKPVLLCYKSTGLIYSHADFSKIFRIVLKRVINSRQEGVKLVLTLKSWFSLSSKKFFYLC